MISRCTEHRQTAQNRSEGILRLQADVQAKQFYLLLVAASTRPTEFCRPVDLRSTQNFVEHLASIAVLLGGHVETNLCFEHDSQRDISSIFEQKVSKNCSA